MKGTHRLTVLLCASLMVLGGSLAAGAEFETIIVQTPPTAGALPLIWIKEQGVLTDQVELEIRVSPDHQRGLALIAQGDIDMLVTGVNVGAKAYNRGIDVRLVNTNIWGIDYLLTNGFAADSWSDLEGKTVSLPLLGGPLDFLVRYFLLQHGVDPADVEFVYSPSNNGARSFQLGQVDAIVLPEPMVTMVLSNFEQAVLSLDLQEEWGKLHEGDNRIPFVGLFAQGGFAEANPGLIEALNTCYQEGIAWVRANPEEAALLAEEYFNQPAAVVAASLERINLNNYPDAEEQALIGQYFNAIMEIYPEMIGGKLPDEDFYF
ncbi:MAG: ABC transporter substrate-binding protein [Syntrophomonadaceae bacterium]|jgi:NitT/TauT family transport system substrate-binding protein|nr:ABC transporter substrate-binding protein [Bacillota bacterium]NLJ02347.1 ABC transporter substrate-binding protein [Bacillota bacterium]